MHKRLPLTNTANSSQQPISIEDSLLNIQNRHLQAPSKGASDIQEFLTTHFITNGVVDVSRFIELFINQDIGLRPEFKAILATQFSRNIDIENTTLFYTEVLKRSGIFTDALILEYMFNTTDSPVLRQLATLDRSSEQFNDIAATIRALKTAPRFNPVPLSEELLTATSSLQEHLTPALNRLGLSFPPEAFLTHSSLLEALTEPKPVSPLQPDVYQSLIESLTPSASNDLHYIVTYLAQETLLQHDLSSPFDWALVVTQILTAHATHGVSDAQLEKSASFFPPFISQYNILVAQKFGKTLTPIPSQIPQAKARAAEIVRNRTQRRSAQLKALSSVFKTSASEITEEARGHILNPFKIADDRINLIEFSDCFFTLLPTIKPAETDLIQTTCLFQITKLVPDDQKPNFANLLRHRYPSTETLDTQFAITLVEYAFLGTPCSEPPSPYIQQLATLKKADPLFPKILRLLCMTHVDETLDPNNHFELSPDLKSALQAYVDSEKSKGSLDAIKELHIRLLLSSNTDDTTLDITLDHMRFRRMRVAMPKLFVRLQTSQLHFQGSKEIAMAGRIRHAINSGDTQLLSLRHVNFSTLETPFLLYYLEVDEPTIKKTIELYNEVNSDEPNSKNTSISMQLGEALSIISTTLLAVYRAGISARNELRYLYNTLLIHSDRSSSYFSQNSETAMILLLRESGIYIPEPDPSSPNPNKQILDTLTSNGAKLLSHTRNGYIKIVLFVIQSLTLRLNPKPDQLPFSFDTVLKQLVLSQLLQNTSEPNLSRTIDWHKSNYAKHFRTASKQPLSFKPLKKIKELAKRLKQKITRAKTQQQAALRKCAKSILMHIDQGKPEQAILALDSQFKDPDFEVTIIEFSHSFLGTLRHLLRDPIQAFQILHIYMVDQPSITRELVYRELCDQLEKQKPKDRRFVRLSLDYIFFEFWKVGTGELETLETLSITDPDFPLISSILPALSVDSAIGQFPAISTEVKEAVRQAAIAQQHSLTSEHLFHLNTLFDLNLPKCNEQFKQVNVQLIRQSLDARPICLSPQLLRHLSRTYCSTFSHPLELDAAIGFKACVTKSEKRHFLLSLPPYTLEQDIFFELLRVDQSSLPKEKLKVEEDPKVPVIGKVHEIIDNCLVLLEAGFQIHETFYTLYSLGYSYQRTAVYQLILGQANISLSESKSLEELMVGLMPTPGHPGIRTFNMTHFYHLFKCLDRILIDSNTFQALIENPRFDWDQLSTYILGLIHTHRISGTDSISKLHTIDRMEHTLQAVHGQALQKTTLLQRNEKSYSSTTNLKAPSSTEEKRIVMLSLLQSLYKTELESAELRPASLVLLKIRIRHYLQSTYKTPSGNLDSTAIIALIFNTAGLIPLFRAHLLYEIIDLDPDSDRHTLYERLTQDSNRFQAADRLLIDFFFLRYKDRKDLTALDDLATIEASDPRFELFPIVPLILRVNEALSNVTISPALQEAAKRYTQKGSPLFLSISHEDKLYFLLLFRQFDHPYLQKIVSKSPAEVHATVSQLGTSCRDAMNAYLRDFQSSLSMAIQHEIAKPREAAETKDRAGETPATATKQEQDSLPTASQHPPETKPSSRGSSVSDTDSNGSNDIEINTQLMQLLERDASSSSLQKILAIFAEHEDLKTAHKDAFSEYIVKLILTLAKSLDHDIWLLQIQNLVNRVPDIASTLWAIVEDLPEEHRQSFIKYETIFGTQKAAFTRCIAHQNQVLIRRFTAQSAFVEALDLDELRSIASDLGQSDPSLVIYKKLFEEQEAAHQQALATAVRDAVQKQREEHKKDQEVAIQQAVAAEQTRLANAQQLAIEEALQKQREAHQKDQEAAIQQAVAAEQVRLANAQQLAIEEALQKQREAHQKDQEATIKGALDAQRQELEASFKQTLAENAAMMTAFSDQIRKPFEFAPMAYKVFHYDTAPFPDGQLEKMIQNLSAKGTSILVFNKSRSYLVLGHEIAQLRSRIQGLGELGPKQRASIRHIHILLSILLYYHSREPRLLDWIKIPEAKEAIRTADFSIEGPHLVSAIINFCQSIT